jgi:hypothetical protein
LEALTPPLPRAQGQRQFPTTSVAFDFSLGRRRTVIMRGVLTKYDRDVTSRDRIGRDGELAILELPM